MLGHIVDDCKEDGLEGEKDQEFQCGEWMRAKGESGIGSLS